MGETFGQFVRRKRKEHEFSLRGLAAKIDISPVHMSNIETDRRPAPAVEYLDRIVAVLRLDKTDAETLYDLAADSQVSAVPGDLPGYIMGRDVVRVALRTAKDVDATDEEWLAFIEKLKHRGHQEDDRYDR